MREVTEDIKLCPVCQTGRASWHIDGKAICGTCDFTADEETWNRLSTAAELLRSV
jgi:hypothetical protein